MALSSPQLATANDEALIAMIRAAHRRLVVVAPGITFRVAQEVIDRWEQLGPDAVTLTLDIDPEVYRLGYGEWEAVEALQDAAQRLNSAVGKQPGIRVGVVISDDDFLVFTPIPQLVESNAGGHVLMNGIALKTGAQVSASEMQEEIKVDQFIASVPVQPEEVKQVTEDLKNNPPMKFDIERKVRVFNARIEFVEFELKGCEISKLTVSIPSDLIRRVNNEQTQRLLRSSIRLVGDDQILTDKPVVKLKEWIAQRYLVSLPGYGNVILSTRKHWFERAVSRLERYLEKYQERMEAHLQQVIDQNKRSLLEAILPDLLANPPQRWGDLGFFPEERVKVRLEDELNRKFRSAKDLMGKMKVSVIFKGVTYESLNDPEFIECVRKKIPALKDLHTEADAVQAAHQQL